MSTLNQQESKISKNKPDNNENKENNNNNKQIEGYLSDLKRLQADFENYIKRIEKEKQEFNKYASYKLMSKLLVLFDDFERTIEITKNLDNQELKEGLALIHKNFNKLLQEEGVKQIEAVGKKFDPFQHEILDIVQGKEDDLIIEELQKGYSLHDKVLRTSKVRITKQGEKQNV